MLKTRILVIISVGISVGFLLGMGVSALLRAMIAGGDRGLEMTFTALVVLMAGILITYGLKFDHDSHLPAELWYQIHQSSPQIPATQANETATIPAVVVEKGASNGFQGKPGSQVSGNEIPAASVPADGEPVVD